MILINVKFPIRPEKSAEWLKLADSYAKAVRAEPGNRFFEFSRSLDDVNTYVCIEGFANAEAGAQHMPQSQVQQFMNTAPDFVSARPQIIYVDAEEIVGFVEMGKLHRASTSANSTQLQRTPPSRCGAERARRSSGRAEASRSVGGISELVRNTSCLLPGDDPSRNTPLVGSTAILITRKTIADLYFGGQSRQTLTPIASR